MPRISRALLRWLEAQVSKLALLRGLSLVWMVLLLSIGSAWLRSRAESRMVFKCEVVQMYMQAPWLFQTWSVQSQTTRETIDGEQPLIFLLSHSRCSVITLHFCSSRSSEERGTTLCSLRKPRKDYRTFAEYCTQGTLTVLKILLRDGWAPDRPKKSFGLLVLVSSSAQSSMNSL